ncbi:MAG: hypothetical protein AVO34_11380 [Firmicutes bacterium ML8_F2]|nr:MAG: hypothetical protein AVO34_11380 [Firmicutes bacterium ML8_F2]
MSFQLGAEWYSEGLLTSRFLPMYQGDELAESHTRADGIIGNISLGKTGKSDVFLIKPFKQFIVLEAKLFSKLSRGTTRMPGYNQAARNIACMANVVAQSSCSIKDFKSLGYYVLAPEAQIKAEPSFTEFMQKELIYQNVLSRVESYKKRSDYLEKQKWFEEHFKPLISKIDLLLISWEELIEKIKKYDNRTGQELSQFYSQCLDFNYSK